jgi:rhodanese-related sulfurtransferase
MRLLLVSLLLIVATVVFYSLYTYAVASRWRISATEARQRLSLGQFDVVLDVRTVAERATLGAYPGSVHIPAGDLETTMPARYPDKGLAILAYCNTGHRARRATDILHKMGYANARYISSSHLSLRV